MPPNAKFLLVSGAIAALAAVVLGAFGAHALRTRLSPELLSAYKTAIEYHFYHALALVILGVLALQAAGLPLLRFAGLAFVAGIVLFSGSLYALALTGVQGLGALTPIGGVAFILGWALLIIAVLRAP